MRTPNLNKICYNIHFQNDKLKFILNYGFSFRHWLRSLCINNNMDSWPYSLRRFFKGICSEVSILTAWLLFNFVCNGKNVQSGHQKWIGIVVVFILTKILFDQPCIHWVVHLEHNFVILAALYVCLIFILRTDHHVHIDHL